MDAHIDMTESMNSLAERLAEDTMYQAICNGDAQAMARLQRQGSVTTTIDLRKETPLGMRQCESLLRFMVDRPLEMSMEDAERDNIVYDGLGEHRILGAKKKKKKKKKTY